MIRLIRTLCTFLVLSCVAGLSRPAGRVAAPADSSPPGVDRNLDRARTADRGRPWPGPASELVHEWTDLRTRGD